MEIKKILDRLELYSCKMTTSYDSEKISECLWEHLEELSVSEAIEIMKLQELAQIRRKLDLLVDQNEN